MDEFMNVYCYIAPLLILVIVIYILFKDDSKKIVKFNKIVIPEKSKYLRCIFLGGYDMPMGSSMILINNRNLELHLVIENGEKVISDVIEIKDIVKTIVNDEDYEFISKETDKVQKGRIVKCYHVLLVMKNNKRLNFYCFKNIGKFL